MKVVINDCYGGFNLSKLAIENYFPDQMGTGDEDGYYSFEPDRTDPRLIKAVQELGEYSYGKNSKLKIVEIPDTWKGQWKISDYDGIETLYLDRYNNIKLIINDDSKNSDQKINEIKLMLTQGRYLFINHSEAERF